MNNSCNGKNNSDKSIDNNYKDNNNITSFILGNNFFSHHARTYLS